MPLLKAYEVIKMLNKNQINYIKGSADKIEEINFNGKVVTIYYCKDGRNGYIEIYRE